MAKKAKVKYKSKLPTIESAYDGKDLIGANLMSQMYDEEEKVDVARRRIKEAAKARPMAPQDPEGTFRNVDGDLVLGDVKKYRKAKVKKKKS